MFFFFFADSHFVDSAAVKWFNIHLYVRGSVVVGVLSGIWLTQEAHTAPGPSFYIIAITHMASGTMGILMRPLPPSQVCSMLIDVITTDIKL